MSKNMFARYVAVLLLALVLGRSESAAVELIILADPINVRTLSGHVRTTTDLDVLKDAHIELFDIETGKLLASTNTDAKGNFYFKSFGKNTYKLKITMLGFDPLQATLRIRKSAPESAVFTLPIAT